MAETEKCFYSTEELEEFRSIIQKKINKAEQLKKQKKEDADSINLKPVGFKTQEEGSELETKEDLLEEVIRQEKFISHLSYALIRINNNHYGYCCKCGRLIDKGRLLSTPHATKCVTCK